MQSNQVCLVLYNLDQQINCQGSPQLDPDCIFIVSREVMKLEFLLHSLKTIGPPFLI